MDAGSIVIFLIALFSVVGMVCVVVSIVFDENKTIKKPPAKSTNTTNKIPIYLEPEEETSIVILDD
jgi:hypothetical protein